MESYIEAIDRTSTFKLKGWGFDIKSELALKNKIGKDFTVEQYITHAAKDFGCKRFKDEPKLTKSARELLE